jgi:hypothetical protein
VAISATAIDPASFTLPVKMKLNTKVSTLPVILQLIALAMERGWESRVRMNMCYPDCKTVASRLFRFIQVRDLLHPPTPLGDARARFLNNEL